MKSVIACGLAAATAVTLALVPAAAMATVGTGVGANPIALKDTAEPGHAYQLPGLYLVNTGDQPTTYHIMVQRLTAGNARDVSAGWVTIGRNDLLLRARESTSVALTLKVPPDAAAGDYSSDIVAGSAPTQVQGATALAASAATSLSFRVGSQPKPGFSLSGLLPPWLELGIGAIALLTLVVLIGRRVGIRVEVRRH